MKATEYFEKYKEQMKGKTQREKEVVAVDMYKEIRKEMFDIAKKRQILSLSSMESLIKETNAKWNKVVRLFTESEICSFLAKDAFEALEMKCLREAFGFGVSK